MDKILIVEDDPVIAGSVANYLSGWGHEVREAADFRDIMPLFREFEPDLVLLDLSLPYYNGYHWCGEIRRESQIPVIFISSAADNLNIVMAMNMGGDDFIAKPFDLNVLTAKVQALLRRSYDFSAAPHLLSCGGAVLNTDDGTLLCGEARVELTRNEYRILRLLMERRGRTVSRDDIMTALWASDSFVDENTLSVNVNRLRKKLEGAGLPDFIHTRKGVGYLVE